MSLCFPQGNQTCSRILPLLFHNSFAQHFLVLILSLHCWNIILCLSMPKVKVRADFPLSSAMKWSMETRAHPQCRCEKLGVDRGSCTWSHCTAPGAVLPPRGHPEPALLSGKYHCEQSQGNHCEPSLKSLWTIPGKSALLRWLGPPAGSSLAVDLCFNLQNILCLCAPVHALLLLEHHWNIRSSPSGTEHVFSFP